MALLYNSLSKKVCLLEHIAVSEFVSILIPPPTRLLSLSNVWRHDRREQSFHGAIPSREYKRWNDKRDGSENELKNGTLFPSFARFRGAIWWEVVHCLVETVFSHLTGDY